MRKVSERAPYETERAMFPHEFFSVVASVADANANVASGEADIAMQFRVRARVRFLGVFHWHALRKSAVKEPLVGELRNN